MPKGSPEPSPSRRDQVACLLDVLRDWAERDHQVVGMALVGSWASGRARPDSDIDVMMLVSNPIHYRETESWVDAIDWRKARLRVRQWVDVDYGMAWSRHLLCEPALEVGLSFAEPN